jgi:hypothetical protein
MKRLLLTFVLCLSTITSHADYIPRTSSQGGFELGAAIGVPALVGIQLGYWGPEGLPLLARASVGLGTAVDIGVHLPINEDPNKRLYLAASGGALGYLRVMSDTVFSLGPSIGARLGNFFGQVGPCLYFTGYNSTLAVQGQFGWSVFY